MGAHVPDDEQVRSDDPAEYIAVRCLHWSRVVADVATGMPLSPAELQRLADLLSDVATYVRTGELRQMREPGELEQGE